MIKSTSCLCYAESVFKTSRHWPRALQLKSTKCVTACEIPILSPVQKQPAPQILFKPSSSPLLPPSIYFPPSSLTSQDTSLSYSNDLIKAPDVVGGCQPLYKITSPTCDYVALRIALLKAGFKRIPSTKNNIPLSANLIWGKSMPISVPRQGSQKENQYNHSKLQHKFQKYNHFPLGHACLGCKEGLSRILQQKNQNVQSSEPSKFFPYTYFYPSQKDEIFQVILNSPKEKQFIWKPSRGSCGRGILICVGGDEKGLLKTIETIKRFEDKARLGVVEHDLKPSVAHPLNGVSPVMFQRYVVQNYITNPLLIEGRKFDLRIYVAVTAYEPFVVTYRHKQGFARFAVNSYLNSEVAEKLSHLTNFSVGRRMFMKQAAQASSVDQCHPLRSSGVIVSDEPSHLTESRDSSFAVLGSIDGVIDKSSIYMNAVENAAELKWTFDYLNTILHERKEVVGAKDPSLINVEKMWKDVDDIIRNTLQAARPKIAQGILEASFPENQPKGTSAENSCYFELYGFDIMFDDECKPWLIEVNTLPSLESSSLKDYAVKSEVVTDFLNLGMLRLFNRTAEERKLYAYDQVSESLMDGKATNQFKLPFSPFPRTELPKTPADMQRYCYSVRDRTQHTTSGVMNHTVETLFQHRLIDEDKYRGGFIRL